MTLDAYLKVIVTLMLIEPDAQQHILIVKSSAERKRINTKFKQLVLSVPEWLRTAIVVSTQRCVRLELGSELLFVLNEIELQGRSPTSVACLATVDTSRFNEYNLKDIKTITEE